MLAISEFLNEESQSQKFNSLVLTFFVLLLFDQYMNTLSNYYTMCIYSKRIVNISAGFVQTALFLYVLYDDSTTSGFSRYFVYLKITKQTDEQG